MTKEEKSILMGIVLGGGHLKKISKYTARLHLEHGEPHREYLTFKTDLIAKILKCKEIPNRKTLRKSGHLRYTATKTCRYFEVLRRFIYRNKRKTYTKHLLNRLNNQALALLWMDVASLRRRLRPKTGSTPEVRSHEAWLWLYTSRQEAELWKTFFEARYGIVPKLAPRKKKKSKNEWFYSLRFNTHDLRKLLPLIKPYACETMLYKFPDV